MKKNAVFIILFVVIIIKAFSQGAMSNDGLFLASKISENGKNYIYIHKFLTKQLIRKIPLKINKIDKLALSEHGKLLSIQSGSNFFIWDIFLEKNIITVYNAKEVYLSPDETFIISLKANSIVKYKTDAPYTATNLQKPNKDIYKAVISPDSKYIAALGTDRIFIYSKNSTNIFKSINGFEIEFSKDAKYFTVLSVWNNIVKSSLYNTAKFYTEHTYISSTLLNKVNATKELFPTRCSLSKEGKIFALYTAKQNYVEIFLFDAYTGKHLWTINNYVKPENALYPQVWTSPSTLVAYGQNLMAGEYNILNQTSKALGIRIDNFTASPDLELSKQQNNRIISPNYHYVAIQSGNKVYIRDTRIPNAMTTYENSHFVCYSPDSKYIFIETNGTINAIVASQLSKAIQKNTKARLYAFDRVLSTVTKESLIPTDAKPPKGYAYFYVNNSLQIVKVDTARLHYVFKTLKLNKNNVELQVNLVDSHGDEFLGATDPSWKYIWCNLLIQNPNGTVKQVNNFQVEEHFVNQPTAYALVLDHSGSMGAKRANMLQFGAKELVLHKRAQDAYVLIKYDNHVKILTNLTKNASNITKYLNNTGINGFGGGTALIDATYFAIKKIENSSYPLKAIILFTDGYENASLHTKLELLEEAKQKGIQINVIGFGDKINEAYLKSIAYTTGGTYVHLYKTEDLKKVFKDIDYKRRHYYSVKFNVQQTGKHIAMLQLCQDFTTHDSLIVSFNNANTNQRIDKRQLVPPLKSTEINIAQFEKMKIPINPSHKPVNSTSINKEFQNIHFPNILFATASDKIVKSEKEGIDEIVKFMRKHPNIFLEIDGHTDNAGTPEFNLDLSIRRAKAAKRLIVKAGIAPGRITVKGFGETKPIASNDTEEGRAQNRRIEFKIFVQK